VIKVNVREEVEPPRPPIRRRTASIELDTPGPMTIGALQAVLVALAEKMPLDAQVQVGHPFVYAFWQEEERRG
jgi:hypothetical protein